MLSFLIFLALFYSNSNIVPAAEGECGPNEIYYNATCSPICDVNCQKLTRTCPLTMTRAVAGCYCRPGYARNLQQQCIRLQDCDTDCFDNEIAIAPGLLACERQCQSTKRNPPSILCYAQTDQRCICSDGHCRNGAAQCVLDS